jgi:hypothetical protein
MLSFILGIIIMTVKTEPKNTTEVDKMLLFGLPGVSSSYFEMNIAQPPQGPILKEVPDFIPEPLRGLAEKVRNRVNGATDQLFNPAIRTPYSGIRLIKDNLENDTGGRLIVDIMEYPDVEELLEKIRTTRYKVIGLSVSCENQVHKAKELVEKIKEIAPDAEIVLGNFGAASGKKLGLLKDEEKVTVLWDPPAERMTIKESGREPWMGEGIRDMRLFLKQRFDRLGIQVDAEPNDPMISNPVPVRSPKPKNPIVRKIKEKTGFLTPSNLSFDLSRSLGCHRDCNFCNNPPMFGGCKTDLIDGIDTLFDIMEKTAAKAREEGSPVSQFNFRDENFTKPMSNLVELCEKIKNSKENIRFMTFSDWAGLYKYWKENNNSFIELSRGGLSTIWIGYESKKDFYKKRGGASPEEIETMTKDLHSVGISVIGSFMVGIGAEQKDGSIEWQTKEDVAEDKKWSSSLGFGTRQVMSDTLSSLASRDISKPHESFVNLTDREIGHKHTRFNPHFSPNELDAQDREWRELFYVENGPATVGYIMIAWEAYINLRESDNPHDIETAANCYWQVKNYIHQMGIVTLGLHGGIFKNHSPEFLSRFARMFDEFEEAEPPQSRTTEMYKKIHASYEEKVSPIALGIGKAVRKIFSWRNRS